MKFSLFIENIVNKICGKFDCIREWRNRVGRLGRYSMLLCIFESKLEVEMFYERRKLHEVYKVSLKV